MQEHFNLMSAFELGETRTREALPHLIVYINNGDDNEKRLAASAITKLMKAGVNCSSAIPFLIKNTGNIKPQVRQYTFKCLLGFALNEEYYAVFLDLYNKETKEYNTNLILEILRRFSSFEEEDILHVKPKANKNVRFPTETKTNDAETATERGFVYFIREDYAGRIKIGKTINLQQRMENFGIKLPFNIELIHSINSNNHHYTEKLFHIHFNEKLVNGEWFELDQEDIEWIKAGNYTKRINESIQYENRREVNKNRFVPATIRQTGFLSSLLSEKGHILNKPITKLSVEEASALIAHLYRGETISDDIIQLLANT